LSPVSPEWGSEELFRKTGCPLFRFNFQRFWPEREPISARSKAHLGKLAHLELLYRSFPVLAIQKPLDSGSPSTRIAVNFRMENPVRASGRVKWGFYWGGLAFCRERA
jgi:hypothetical protein